MTQKKQRVVVICPGRGTYNKEELGYLTRLHADKKELVEVIDDYRTQQDQITISALDSMDNYSMRTHTAGENASALIYACALADFKSIDPKQYDIVAVTGNSMGWYIALAAANALDEKGAIQLINTMGSMMSEGVIGGQLIYPVIDQHWRTDQSLIALLDKAVAEVKLLKGAELYLSIELGGYRVFGGNSLGLKALEEKLPLLDDRYPMNLFNHAAFHTPLLQAVANKAQEILSGSLFRAPKIPLIDGVGNIWQPHSTNVQALYNYTLQNQVVEPYQFSRAIEVAIKEFAPDKLIILGPGSTLGGAVAQCLIEHQWKNIVDKEGFIAGQKQDPFVLAMGLSEQRKLVVG